MKIREDPLPTFRRGKPVSVESVRTIADAYKRQRLIASGKGDVLDRVGAEVNCSRATVKRRLKQARELGLIE